MRNTLITVLGTTLVPVMLHLLIPSWILQNTSGWTAPDFGLIELVSILAALGGYIMVIWVAVIFVRRGKGTAMPLLPPTEFVPMGFYQYVRNPMYLGLLLVILAEAVVFRSLGLLIYASLLWLAVHSYVVYVEEPDLLTQLP